MTKTELENCIWEHGKEIYSFCLSLTLNSQEADDLYQDTFLKAMELLHQINYRHNPKSYLLSVALKLWKNNTHGETGLQIYCPLRTNWI